MRIFSVFKKETTPLGEQIRSYIEWGMSMNITAHGRKGMLDEFGKFCTEAGKLSISEISDKDIEDYIRLTSKERSRGTAILTAEAIKCFLRYCRSRKIPCIHEQFIHINHKEEIVFHYGIMDKMTLRKKWIGRPPQVRKIEKIKQLRDENKLSFREIARVVGGDVESAHRKYKYPIERYKEAVGIK